MAQQREQTMRLRANTGITSDRASFARGDEFDWPITEAKRFIERGYATAVVTAPENAAGRN